MEQSASLLAALLPLLPAFLSGATAPRPQADRPLNVLVILADQHNANALGCYGNGFGGLTASLTPNLDRLAAEGVRFENAYCSAPQCTPSRVSILTGRWPHNHGVRWNEIWEPQDLVTFPMLFREAGYATATIGKHHLMWLEQELPEASDLGFDQVLDIDDYALFCHQNGQPLYYGNGNHWDMPGLPPLLKMTGHTASTNRFHPTGWIADNVIEFLEARAGEQGDGRPFVCFYSMYSPHTPILPSGSSEPEDWAHRYHPFDQLGLPPNVGKVATTARLERFQQEFAGVTDDQHREILSYYYGLITQMDWNIGRVLARLDELGLADDTLVLYTCDHGEMAGEMRTWTKGTGSYDAVTRVPLIVRMPGVLPAGVVEDALTSNIDLFPTIAELAGITVPDDVRSRVDGRSMVDLMLFGEEEAGWRDEVFCEFGFEQRNVKRQLMVRTKAAKYVRDEYGNQEELYDLVNDPFEVDNLIGNPDPDVQAVTADLRARLIGWWADERGHAPFYAVTGGPGELPAPATAGRPSRGETGVRRDVDFAWLPSTSAFNQYVYLGTDPNQIFNVGALPTMAAGFNPGTLLPLTTYYWRVDSANPAGVRRGYTWVFTTEAAGAGGPGLATSPQPPDGATRVALTTPLAWKPCMGTLGQTLHFGPAGALGELAGGLSASVQGFDPGPLEAGRRYEWRVDETDGAGTTIGTVWSFRTTADGLPEEARAVAPLHLSMTPFAPTELVWAPGVGARSHDVYFGRTFPLTRQGRFDEARLWTGPMEEGTYYWRVDEVNDLGTRTGRTWRFTVRR